MDDPEGFHQELMSDAGALEDKLDLWLIDGANRFRREAELSQALLRIAKHEDSRTCLLLLSAILDNPGLAERLMACTRDSAEQDGAGEEVQMTWSDFYLICFAVGVGFSILAFVGGLHFHLHIGHWRRGPRASRTRLGPGKVNAGTIAAFLAWFRRAMAFCWRSAIPACGADVRAGDRSVDRLSLAPAFIAVYIAEKLSQFARGRGEELDRLRNSLA